MISFDDIMQLAIQKKGNKKQVMQDLPEPASRQHMINKSDDRYLSDMSRRIFQAGLSWKMVNNKWPIFEQQFFQFNPKRCAFLNADEIEARMRDTRLIRHLSKIKSIQHNAMMVEELAQAHGSFGQWLADWPEDDIVGLWMYLFPDLLKRHTLDKAND